MPANLFFEAGPELSVGAIFHETTKNFRAGRLHQGYDAIESVRPVGSWHRDALPESGEGYSLAAVDTTVCQVRGSALETLLFRRSVRRYSGADLQVAQLRRLLELVFPQRHSTDLVTDKFPHLRIRRGPLPISQCRLIALVLEVEGIPSGAYWYDPPTSTLHTIHPTSPRPVVERIVFQAEFHRANVIFLLTASLADTVQRYGDRGYRYMLIEGGMMIQALYLAASHLKLSGCVTGSLIQQEFERWLGLDGYQACMLNAFAIGHLPDEDSANV